MQAVLTSTADTAMHAARFVQRRSKLTGALFAQILVFGWLGNPQAALDELARTAAALGLAISPRGLDGHFSPRAAELLRRVLETAMHALVAANPVATPLLAQFNDVYLYDSSAVALPEALADLWPGSVASAPAATLKRGIRLALASGALLGRVLRLPGRWVSPQQVRRQAEHVSTDIEPDRGRLSLMPMARDLRQALAHTAHVCRRPGRHPRRIGYTASVMCGVSPDARRAVIARGGPLR